MQLTAEQQASARQWIADGMKLSDFQRRLESDFGLRITYMDVRLLVDDLKVVPKDPEPPKTPAAPSVLDPVPAAPAAAEPGTGLSKVSVTTDAVMHPGTMISGKATFSDGQKAVWYVDQTGRMGLAPETKGYRPSREDIEELNLLLDREFAKMGM
ncbi:MAG TPA: hypothetical protein VMF06_22300 [Candidatus Limnocylindria bacterium]|jgi:hypothetical protein|nr:hypothetical protein [Candidatus Limnocylindria bacterium]